MVSENKPLPLASGEENSEITRRVLGWLNGFPGLPVKLIDFENLQADRECMALHIPTGAAIRKRYILGGHQGELSFILIYRCKPDTVDKRLKAVELLDALGDQAAANLPGLNLGSDTRALGIEVTTRAALAGRNDNGDEEFQIFLKLIYERNVK